MIVKLLKDRALKGLSGLSKTEGYLLAVVIGIILAAAITVILESRGPRGMVERVPDFSAFQDVNERKAAFFEFLLPFIHEQNAIWMRDRSRILEIQERFTSGMRLNRSDSRWIMEIRENMGFEPSPMDASDFFKDLLSRVDAIPPSLALAQAANESGWGTSRFAREGNNFYGIWCYRPGCGIVPLRRPAGATYEVTRYSSVRGSVADYFATLNTGSAYLPMRLIRQQLRGRNEAINGVALANGLQRYSERGMAYVQDVQSLIHSNNLLEHDV